MNRLEEKRDPHIASRLDSGLDHRIAHHHHPFNRHLRDKLTSMLRFHLSNARARAQRFLGGGAEAHSELVIRRRRSELSW
jgi:hypothetical protein